MLYKKDVRYLKLNDSFSAYDIVSEQKKGDGHILLNDNDLNDGELYYMDYFPAQTVGDLVFNYWDYGVE